MRIDFENQKEVTIPHLNQGEGEVSARMFMDPSCKIMVSRIHVGSSIGVHSHLTSCEINYCMAGKGIHICDGVEESLEPGMCVYCPQGASHSIVNTGGEDLVLFTVVPERK